MSDVIIVSGDGLRRLASDTRETKWRIGGVHSEVASLLARIDRSGWPSQDMDGAWGDASARLSQVAQRLDGAQADLQRRGLLADELNHPAPDSVCSAVDSVLSNPLMLTAASGASSGPYQPPGSTAPGVWEYLDWLKGIPLAVLLAGRSSQLGKLLGFLPDLRTNPWRNLKILNKSAGGKAGFFLIDVLLELASHPDEQNPRGVGIAVGKSAIETVIVANPVGFWVMVGNTAVQLGGSVGIWGSTALAKSIVADPARQRALDLSADRAETALKKIDVGNITRGLSTILVDGAIGYADAMGRAASDAWKNPSVGNILRLGAYSLSGPIGGMVVANLVDPEAREKTFENFKNLGGSIRDFAVGLREAPVTLVQHAGTVVTTVTEDLWDRYGGQISRAANEALDGIAKTLIPPLPKLPIPLPF